MSSNELIASSIEDQVCVTKNHNYHGRVPYIHYYKNESNKKIIVLLCICYIRKPQVGKTGGGEIEAQLDKIIRTSIP